MNSTYHTTYQYHFCLGENLLRGDGAQSCLSVCHQSSLSSPLSSPLLHWLRHQCWQIIQSGDDTAFRQSVIFPNNCANKPNKTVAEQKHEAESLLVNRQQFSRKGLKHDDSSFLVDNIVCGAKLLFSKHTQTSCSRIVPDSGPPLDA